MITELFITNQSGTTHRVPTISTEVFHKKNTSAGKLTAKILSCNIPLEMGNTVTLKFDGSTFFVGYLFSSLKEKDFYTITAFDQIRYLLYKDSRILNGITASTLVTQIAKEKGLSLGNIDNSQYVFGSKIFRDNTYLSMIDSCLQETFSNTNFDYVLYDKAGLIHLRRSDDLVLTTALTDTSNILSYECLEEIFSNTFNYIKAVRENKKTGQRDVFTKSDTGNQSKWGTLQHYKNMPEKTLDGEIQNYLQNTLREKNRPNKVISIFCIGDKSFFVGHIVAVKIKKLSYSGFFVINEITHIIENGTHLCRLKLEFIQNI